MPVRVTYARKIINNFPFTSVSLKRCCTNNNIIYHDIAFRSSQKGNNNNNEITTEKIKQQRPSNISKRKEPKDSNPKVHIISKKKGFKKYK